MYSYHINLDTNSHSVFARFYLPVLGLKKEITATLCLSKRRENKRITSVYTKTSLVGLIKDLGFRVGYRMLNINNVECM